MKELIKKLKPDRAPHRFVALLKDTLPFGHHLDRKQGVKPALFNHTAFEVKYDQLFKTFLINYPYPFYLRGFSASHLRRLFYKSYFAGKTLSLRIHPYRKPSGNRWLKGKKFRAFSAPKPFGQSQQGFSGEIV